MGEAQQRPLSAHRRNRLHPRGFVVVFVVVVVVVYFCCCCCLFLFTAVVTVVVAVSCDSFSKGDKKKLVQVLKVHPRESFSLRLLLFL